MHAPALSLWPFLGDELFDGRCWQHSAAGVDPQLAVFHRLPETSSGDKQVPWAYLSSKRPHTHDVRALCVAAGKHLPDGPRLYSGSNDVQLLCHSVERYLKVSAPIGRCCQAYRQQVAVVAQAPSLLCLELWPCRLHVQPVPRSWAWLSHWSEGVSLVGCWFTCRSTPCE